MNLLRPVLLFCAALAVVACVHDPITLPEGPGGVIVGADETGVTFNDAGKALWVKEGVPAEWFIQTSLGWHLTTLQWHQGNSIRMKDKNP